MEQCRAITCWGCRRVYHGSRWGEFLWSTMDNESLYAHEWYFKVESQCMRMHCITSISTSFFPPKAISTAHVTKTTLLATSALSLTYKIATAGNAGNDSGAEGIYVRNPADCIAMKTYKVDVSPVFAPQCPNDVKTAFEQRVVLKCFEYPSPDSGAAGKGKSKCKSKSHP